MMFIELRDYQEHALQVAKSATKNMLLVGPTGCGKTWVIAFLAWEWAFAGKRVKVISHRSEIVGQLYGTIEWVKQSRGEPDGQIDCSTIQQMMTDGRPSIPYDYTIVDEAHHYHSNKWIDVAKRLGSSRMIGFTATPQRPDGKPMGGSGGFDELYQFVMRSELLARGFVVPSIHYAPPQPKKGHAVDSARAYLEYGEGRQALIYAKSVDDAYRISARLRSSNTPAEVICSNTHRDDREDYEKKFRQGKVKVLVNYATLTEGVDFPEASCIVIGREVDHRSNYLQMVGRGGRAAQGKKDCLVLDVAGVGRFHGDPDWDRKTSLIDYEPIAFGAPAGHVAVMMNKGRVQTSVTRAQFFEPLSGGLERVTLDWYERNSRLKIIDTRSIDWSKPNTETARSMGVGEHVIRKIRLDLRIPPVDKTEVGRAVQSRIPPEVRSDRARKSNLTRTHEERSESIKDGMRKNPERHREAGRRRYEAKTEEQKAAFAMAGAMAKKAAALAKKPRYRAEMAVVLK